MKRQKLEEKIRKVFTEYGKKNMGHWILLREWNARVDEIIPDIMVIINEALVGSSIPEGRLVGDKFGKRGDVSIYEVDHLADSNSLDSKNDREV